MNSIVADFESVEPLPLSELEDHIKNLSKTLDFLLLEKKLDEALDVIQFKEENFQKNKV